MLVLAMQFSRGSEDQVNPVRCAATPPPSGEGDVEHTFRTEQRTERRTRAGHREDESSIDERG